MRIFLLPVLAAIAFSSAAATPPAGDITYAITVQDDYGIETRQLKMPLDGSSRRVVMVAAVVEVSPPGIGAGPSIVRVFSGAGPNAALLHTARIDGPRTRPINIGYTICGCSVIVQSPTPEKLRKCAAPDPVAMHDKR